MTIEFERAERESIGLTIIEISAEHLLVQSVKEIGVVPSWNFRNQNQAILPGDLITDVNGIRESFPPGDAAEMLWIMQTSKQLRVSLKRPQGDFKATMQRKEGEQQKGVGVSILRSALGVKVHGLKDEGLIPDWNKAHQHMPEVQFEIGDEIIDVNGISEDIEQMLRQCKQAHIVLTVRRPSSPASQSDDTADEAADDGRLEEVMVHGLTSCQGYTTVRRGASFNSFLSRAKATARATSPAVPRSPYSSSMLLRAK